MRPIERRANGAETASLPSAARSREVLAAQVSAGTAAEAAVVAAARWAPRLRRESAAERPSSLRPRPAPAALSFSELGKQRTVAAFDEVVSRLGVLRSDAAPHEPEIKRFRQDLLKLRDQVDLFAHAYARGGDEKTWKQLRDNLDQGYAAVGNFKDLFDSKGLSLSFEDPVTHAFSAGVRPEAVEYRNEDVERLRQRALAWKDGFGAPAALAKTRAFLSAPAEAPSDIRRGDLSGFFWGGVDIKPLPELTGAENLARLNREQFTLARADLAKVANFENLTKPKAEDAFHDLRKRMRSANNVLERLPELVASPEVTQAMQKKLRAFISAYGSIENKLVAFHLAAGQGSQDWAKAIDKAWSKLRARQETEDLDGLLRDLADALHPPAHR
jgi:hypothetical protein